MIVMMMIIIIGACAHPSRCSCPPPNTSAARTVAGQDRRGRREDLLRAAAARRRARARARRHPPRHQAREHPRRRRRCAQTLWVRLPLPLGAYPPSRPCGAHAGSLKLTDFGFATHVDSMTHANGMSGRCWTLCGTPLYMSPEMALQKGHGKPTDFWSLGVVIFELMAGDCPPAPPHPLVSRPRTQLFPSDRTHTSLQAQATRPSTATTSSRSTRGSSTRRSSTQSRCRTYSMVQSGVLVAP